jgi:cytidine deaminase
MPEIDWDTLRSQAMEACREAYAPYSGFPVGAAALVDDGRIVAGCNVENASYGLTLCAECGVISALHTGGGGRLLAIACVRGDGADVTPCGRCRQLLHEHGARDLVVNERPLRELLPDAFGAGDLPDAPELADDGRGAG